MKIQQKYRKEKEIIKTLFDTTYIHTMVLKNRFIRAAVHEHAPGGHIPEHFFDVYKKYARGGVGTIITGFALVDEAEKSFPVMGFYDDSFCCEHKKLIDCVHAYHANIILQLVYVGSYVMGDPGKTAVLAPSVVENRNTKIIPQEITEEQIKNIQAKFAQAVVRAKQTGYDGIEIHAAHGFLLSQFMTPYYNRRKDLYGGSAQNRARMSLETYQAIKKAAGDDFPILIKINVNDGFEGGVLFDDVLYLCHELSQEKIGALEISGAFNMFTGESTSFFRKEAEEIARENDATVILTGGNKDFKEMTDILKNTGIQYFGMARPLMKDPDLINHFKAAW
jgi:2,4-dienoyl-CoA reductase-like NADH-dependent reductase (Old Yellow Enzyme family)